MGNGQLNLRRIAVLGVSSFLILFVIARLWHYYNTGTITVTTDNSYNTITLSKIDGETGQILGKSLKNNGRLYTTTGTGTYSISVTGNSIATTQTIKLGHRQALHYTINPINATGVEPVAYENAQSMAASSQKLVYLSGSSSRLYKISSQNNLEQMHSSQQFRVVKWADPNFGIGQGKGRLYSIINGVVRPLKVPFLYKDGVVDFDVSSTRKIYVSYGAAVYSGDADGRFKKVYTASSSRPALAAGVDSVAVSDAQYGEKPSGAAKPLLAIVNTSGKIKKGNIEAERVSWTPNGKYLISVNQSNPVIYDSALHKIALVPTDIVIGQFVWLGKSTLLYTQNDQVWAYDLLKQKAQLLANMPFGASITAMCLSNNNSYIYVTTFDSTANTYAVKRVGLKGQVVPDYIYELQSVLPENLDSYSISLLNFAAPATILVHPHPGVSAGNYVQQAQTQLQSLGFDTSGLHFQEAQPLNPYD